MIEKIDNKDVKKRQVDMHRDFFVRAELAVNNRFYLEAIILEYAAIEGRLEVILGVLGFPCNKELNASKKMKVNISDRIECLRAFRNKNPEVFARSNLPTTFFTQKGDLKKWLEKRNAYVHGLYKNADAYALRKDDSCDIAKQGLKYSKLLYNEAKRLNRMLKSHPEMLSQTNKTCQNSNCIVIKDKSEEQEASNV